MIASTQLNDYLTKLAKGGLCVAFSGGVDSAALLKAACTAAQCVGAKSVHAVTVSSVFHSPKSLLDAEKLAKEYGAVFKLLKLELPDEVIQNPADRCYICKKAVFTAIKSYADENGLETVLDGTIADDLNEYRPGLKALAELDIKSPLAELRFSKDTVRMLARETGVSVAEKPSSPCLATRIPYNTRIEPETLAKIDAFEAHLKSLGFAVVRARVHGSLVRLEIAEEKLVDLLAVRADVLAKAKELGFAHVTLDLQGFRSGSWDKLEAGNI